MARLGVQPSTCNGVRRWSLKLLGARSAHLPLTVLVAALLFSACQAAPSGDAEAVRDLYGQRVGVVIRVDRHLIGEHGTGLGEAVNYRWHVATDSPEFTYGLALATSDDIEASVGQLFEPVMLEDYTVIPPDINGLGFDGDLIRVTPTSPVTVLPPDAVVEQIMVEKNLAGLIVIDETWFLDTEYTNTLGCGMDISLMDSDGNVVFTSEGALSPDDAKMSSFFQDFVNEFTAEIAGNMTLDDFKEAIDSITLGMAETMVERFDAVAATTEER